MVAVPTQRSAKRPASIKSRVDTGSGTSTSAGAGSDTGVGCVSCRARKQNENEGHKRQQKSATAGINQAQHPHCRARTECIWAGGGRKGCRIPQSSVPARQGLSTRRRTCTSSISAQDAVSAGEQSRDQDRFSSHVAQREQTCTQSSERQKQRLMQTTRQRPVRSRLYGVVLADESKGRADDAGWGHIFNHQHCCCLCKIKCQNMRLMWHGFLGTVCIYIHSTGCFRFFN
jgi:hypothetical protein